MQWENGRLSSATILSNQGGECVLYSRVPLAVQGASAQSSSNGEGYTIRFQTSKEKTYHIKS